MRLLAVVLLLAACAWPASEPDIVASAWNAFAAEANRWAALEQEQLRNPGTLDARIPAEWKLVRESFRKLDRAAKASIPR